MGRAVGVILVLIGLCCARPPVIDAQDTDTPTPTVTPTPTATFTPTPAVNIVLTLPPPEATDELGSPVPGQAAEFVYRADVGQVVIAGLLSAILITIWVVFVFWVWKGRRA